MSKYIALFSLIFLVNNCGGRDIFNSTIISELIGTWRGCVTPSLPTNTSISSAFFNLSFDEQGGFLGSYSFYPTSDCSGDPQVTADQLVGTFSLGSSSLQVADAIELQITITSCTSAGGLCDSNNWNSENTIYEIFKIDNTGLLLGQCLRDLTCINPDGRPTALLGPLSKISGV